MSRRTLVLLGAAGALALVAVVALFLAESDEREESLGGPTTTSADVTTTTAAPTTTVEGSPGAAGVGDPYFPGLGNGGYDVQHYHLALTWLADAGRLEGVTTIEAVATQDLNAFNLDLSGMEVSAVTVDGAVADAQLSDRELVVTPSEIIPSGERFIVEVVYGGAPEPIAVGTDLFRVGWQTDGREAFVVSEPAGAATFFPVNDHPSDKATYTFEVTAPADQVVAANGVLEGEAVQGDGTRTWTYEADSPMASYLVQIAIGDYVLEEAGEAAGVPLRHALHTSFLEQARQTVARTGDMVELLTDVFGVYPFDAYGVLAVDEPLGFALETQTLTIIGSDVGTRGRGADQILVHELAHQWVGNSVSPATWKDIWLNEGFASYAEWLWVERSGGPSAAETARRVAANARGLEAPPGDPGPDELFEPTVYLRGAMTLQALREAIGDEPFFSLLREWVVRHEHDVAATEDLIALSEETSSQQLDALFEEWLYEPGLPALR